MAVTVAVDRLGEVVSPCGMCRELVLDYAPEAVVVLPGDDGPEVVPLAGLQPRKCRGR